MAGLREVTNKVAVVTGASGGIGAELARQLARKGMRLALSKFYRWSIIRVDFVDAF